MQKARPAGGRAATRKMPERAAAEVYRDVLEGARKAREAGHDHVEDEEEDEEEDDDFSLEQRWVGTGIGSESYAGRRE